MNGIVTESLVELLGVVISAVAAGVLTVVGALAENAGLADLLAGQSVFGLWELGMGALALYAGIYLLGYKRVVVPVGQSLAN
ncbi:hypothetical protein [Haloarcula montana]|uniref:hypothetical protein n=1 Tax=Haloarcula montana TaxID=3111776 RepID=UPI002D781F93|nr:hypothetical protein [Haloarcula sp. GH36]